MPAVPSIYAASSSRQPRDALRDNSIPPALDDDARGRSADNAHVEPRPRPLATDSFPLSAELISAPSLQLQPVSAELSSLDLRSLSAQSGPLSRPVARQLAASLSLHKRDALDTLPDDYIPPSVRILAQRNNLKIKRSSPYDDPANIPPFLTPLKPLDSLDSQPWPSSNILPKRDSFVFVPLPAVYKGLGSGPAPGVVVGIVLGSVVGFLLIFWLVYAVTTFGYFRGGNVQGEDTEIVVERQHHSSHHSSHGEKRRRRKRTHRSSHHSSHRGSPARPPPPQPQPSRRERIIVDETVKRTVSRPRRESSVRETVRESVIVEERSTARRVPGDDEVEVIEEHSEISEEVAPRRKKSAKSGYRTVDPNAYGGGNYPQKDVRPPRR